ncbi:unnamed protein product [Peronospora belbahrii]|uniref:Uncharacterized protein n=1 Tax=Peronospora belbahrii TaxID=622444 RepID=A0AAU9LGJ2_9STRA|nr:unnamed protein product [Peronospora belbahrii]
MESVELKDLGNVKTFLGMSIEGNPQNGYLIDQELTIMEMLEKHGLRDANVVKTPISSMEIAYCGDHEFRGLKYRLLYIGPPDTLTRPLWPDYKVAKHVASYSDADFAADREDRKSVSANVVLVNGIVAGWNCKKQGTLALYTAEAEFVAGAVGGIEALGLKELFEKMEAIEEIGAQ